MSGPAETSLSTEATKVRPIAATKQAEESLMQLSRHFFLPVKMSGHFAEP